MLKSKSPTQQAPPDSELLAEFLHEVNIARRNLTLYPPSHPQVANSGDKAYNYLQKLLCQRYELALGIAPDAIFFEDHWLEREQPTFKQFAQTLSELGIASINFKRKTSASELIQLCKLLHDDRETIEELGGFEQQLAHRQIKQILIVPIDYSVFREKNSPAKAAKPIGADLWEDFLRGLQKDILDLDQSGLHVAPKTIAELLNRKLATAKQIVGHHGAAGDFIEQFIASPLENTNSLAEFLEHLCTGLQTEFLSGTLHVLEERPELANQVLPELPPSLLEKIFAPELQEQLRNSPRLVALVKQLASANPEEKSQSVTPGRAQLNSEIIRARLEVLFSEEQYERYLPENYQAALENILSADSTGKLPEEVRQELKVELENQPLEQQCCAIIFELLEAQPPLENEDAVQQNLVDLSNYFLDTGNFTVLREIYLNWSNYLHSGRSKLDILTERVLANHTQHHFIQEVVDGIDIWGATKAAAIRDYIAAIGEPYTEPVIEQLGQAKHFSQRRYWMEVLTAIGTDANQLLIESLTDERWYLIRNLLTVLGKALSPAALKAIQKMATHPHPKVRQEVIRVLFAYNPATANRLLSKELANPHPEIRLGAIKIADLSNAPEILGYLHQQLQTAIDSEQDLDYKREVLKTLARIGSDQTLDLLSGMLAAKSLFTPKRMKQFYSDIIQSLTLYPHDKAEKRLRKLAAEGARQHAKLALEHLKNLRGEPS